MVEEEDIQDFVRTNGVDEHAANVLRECSPNTRRQVLDRGSLSGARNPSSVLLARIRDAKAMMKKSGADTCYVRMRGLPFSVTEDDIIKFFDGFDLVHDGVVLCMSRDGRTNGEAIVQFHSEGDANQAIRDRNRESIGDRWVELFPSSEADSARAATANGSTEDGLEGATPEEVEDFLNANDVDQRAGEALRDCKPSVQLLVVSRGDLKGARNPSSVLLARIRDAQKDAQAGRGHASSRREDGRDGGDNYGRQQEDEVERYIRENDLDESAADALRRCRPDVKDFILDRGPVKTARNPSSALLARIKEAKNVLDGGRDSGGGYGGGHGSGHGGGYDAGYRDAGYRPAEPVPHRADYGSRGHSDRGASVEEVEDFLRRYDVDQRACDALRECAPAIQKAVIDDGDLSRARNPSAVLLTRIKKVSAEMRAEGSSGYGAHPSRPAPNSYDRYAPYEGGSAARDPRGGDPRGGGHDAHSLANRVEDFLEMEGNRELDRTAADALRECPPEIAERVMERGPVLGARNPSSCLMSRIRDIKTELGRQGTDHYSRSGGRDADPYYGGGRAPEPYHDSQRDWSDRSGGPVSYNDYGRQPEPARGYGERQPEPARGYGERQPEPARGYGERQPEPARGYGERQPEPVHGYGERQPEPARGYGERQPEPARGYGEDRLESFIRDSGLDEAAGNALRQADPMVQDYIVDKGVAGARNPSSAVMARIREARTDLFGREAAARTGGGGSGGGGKGGGNFDWEDLERFISTNQIDDKAAEDLRQCTPQVKDVVLRHGLAGARNPSAALTALIRDVKKRVGERPPDRGGDAPSKGHDTSSRDFGGSGGGGSLYEQVERFIDTNNLDEKAAEVLFSSDPEVQRVMLAQGLRGVRNPSAAVTARLRDIKIELAGGKGARRQESGAGRRSRSRKRSRSRRRDRSRSRSRRRR